MDASIAQIIQDRANANGVDPAILAQIATVESGGDPNASASSSSAKGLFQFTGPTWKQYGQGDPLDPAANADAGARFTKDNATGLASAGIEASPANIYLAHFSGLGGAKKVLTADPSTPVASILGDDAVSANPFLKGMTAGDLQGWAAKKMGSTAAAPTAPSGSRPTTGILNQTASAPTGKPGMLNGADAPDEPDLTNVLAKALPPIEQAKVPALSPIQYAMPKHIDRAKLMAALTRKVA